jgi:pimeloyl-CoA synthetase
MTTINTKLNTIVNSKPYFLNINDYSLNIKDLIKNIKSLKIEIQNLEEKTAERDFRILCTEKKQLFKEEIDKLIFLLGLPNVKL